MSEEQAPAPEPIEIEEGRPWWAGEEGYAYVQFIIEDERIPETLRRFLWTLLSRVHALTDLNDRDVKSIYAQMCAVLDLYAIAIPDYEFDMATLVTLEGLRAFLKSHLRRGHKSNLLRWLATQIRVSEYRQEGEGRRSLLARLFGR
mgnify:CR=1 FL=1